ncbi:MAG: FAD-dependent oxidoreductase [Candidatus Aenigmatarchaeota archaeon]
MQKFDVAIIGGGILGLTAAHELVKNKLKIVIIEKNNYLGGFLQTIKAGKGYVETYYHHFFTSDNHLFEKLKELKIDKNLEWNYASTAFLFDEGIYELSSPHHIFSFKPLTLKEKIQFIWLMLKIKFSKNNEKLDHISAKDWIISNSSKSLYKKMFEPLLKSKFGKKATEISASWLIERINMRSKRSLKGEKLAYLKGSCKILVDALEKEIRKMGAKIIVNANLEKIEKKQDFELTVNGEILEAKAVISTIPLGLLRKYKLFDEKFDRKIKKIEYQHSLCILVSLKKSLSRYYWINIAKDSKIGAIIEHTNFQPKELYDGHIIYLAQYPDEDSEVWKQSDEEIWENYFYEMKKLFPQISKGDVNWYKIFRGFDSGVIYKKGFKKNFLGYETPLQGFFIGGQFNMYPERSVNLAIKMGKEIAQRVSKYVKD